MILSFKSFEIRPCIEIEQASGAKVVSSYQTLPEFESALETVDRTGAPYQSFWTLYGRHGDENLATAIGDFANQESALEIARALVGAGTAMATLDPAFAVGPFAELAPLVRLEGHAQTALCLWESMLDWVEINSENPALIAMKSFWDGAGEFEMRSVAIALAAPVEAVWEELDKLKIEPIFDWEFVPAILEFVDWHSTSDRPGLLPGALAAMVEKFGAKAA